MEVSFKDWWSKGITKVKHLQKPECNSYLSLKDFQLKYDLNVAPLHFCGLISAVKTLGNSSLKEVNDNKQEYKPLSTKLSNCKKASALVYKSLVRNKGEAPRNSQKKWLMDCSCFSSENLNWSSVYLLALCCTKSKKLIEFHFKLVHRHLATNNFLFKIKLEENGNCTFCQNAPETLIHLFWACQKSSKLWKSVMEWLQKMNIIQNNFTLLNTTALGLKPDTSKMPSKLTTVYC